MLKFNYLSTTYLLLFGYLFVAIQAKPRTRVVGGSSVPDGKYPYQAFIKVANSFQCGASILNSHYVLTAAHCVSGQKSNLMTVVLGTNSRVSDKGDVYNVSTYVIHDDYYYPTFVAPVNDIAVVRLSSEIVFNEKVQPIKLPIEQSELDMDSAVLTGWGSLNFLGASPIKLQEIELKVLDQDTCSEKWQNYKKVNIVNTQLCTSSKKGEGACNGDSGGPLVSNGVQIGIVSFGGMPCGKGIPDVFTRVSSYINWINIHMY